MVGPPERKPGERKTPVFSVFLRGKSGETFTRDGMVREFGEYFLKAPEGSAAPSTGDRAARSFLLASCKT